MKKRLTIWVVFLICFVSAGAVAFAEEGQLTVSDYAGLFTETQTQALIEDYSAITEYMDAEVLTVDTYLGETSSVAEQYAIQAYGNDPAVIFMIDMYNRQIYVYANGDALKTISRADSRAITDNIYKYASQGDYYGCAAGALEQILGKCQGQRLSRPVKHITNAMIAILLGILINYLVVVQSRKARRERRTAGSVSVNSRPAVLPAIGLAAPLIISSMRIYHNNDSGGSGGFGGGGGGFSGGGGGHSGGGGGHSF